MDACSVVYRYVGHLFRSFSTLQWYVGFEIFCPKSEFYANIKVFDGVDRVIRGYSLMQLWSCEILLLCAAKYDS